MGVFFWPPFQKSKLTYSMYLVDQWVDDIRGATDFDKLPMFQWARIISNAELDFIGCPLMTMTVWSIWLFVCVCVCVCVCWGVYGVRGRWTPSPWRHALCRSSCTCSGPALAVSRRMLMARSCRVLPLCRCRC